MPEMNGRELADKIRSICPQVKTIFMSGYTGNIIAQHDLLTSGAHFIQKPFSRKDLAVMVRNVLNQ
jgi:two-component system cell cycle sensor histidine kinase/response regulator CckA